MEGQVNELKDQLETKNEEIKQLRKDLQILRDELTHKIEENKPVISILNEYVATSLSSEIVAKLPESPLKVEQTNSTTHAINEYNPEQKQLDQLMLAQSSRILELERQLQSYFEAIPKVESQSDSRKVIDDELSEALAQLGKKDQDLSESIAKAEQKDMQIANIEHLLRQKQEELDEAVRQLTESHSRENNSTNNPAEAVATTEAEIQERERITVLLQESQMHRDSLENELENLRNENEKLKIEISKLQAAVSLHSGEEFAVIQQVRSQLEAIQEKARLEQEQYFIEHASHVDQQNAVIVEMQQELDDKHVEIVKLTEEVSVCRSYKQKSDELVESTTQLVNMLNEQIAQQRIEILELTSANEHWSNQLNAYIEHIEKSKQIVEMSTLAQQNVEEEARVLLEKVQADEQLINQMHEEAMRKENELAFAQELVRELQAQEKSNYEAIAQQENFLLEFQQAKKAHQISLQLQQQNILSLLNQLSSANNTIELLTNQNSYASSAEAIESLKGNEMLIEKLLKEVEDLKEANQGFSNEIIRLSKELSRSQGELITVQEEKSEMSIDLDQLTRTVNSQQVEINRLLAALIEFEQKHKGVEPHQLKKPEQREIPTTTEPTVVAEAAMIIESIPQLHEGEQEQNEQLDLVLQNETFNENSSSDVIPVQVIETEIRLENNQSFEEQICKYSSNPSYPNSNNIYQPSYFSTPSLQQPQQQQVTHLFQTSPLKLESNESAKAKEMNYSNERPSSSMFRTVSNSHSMGSLHALPVRRAPSPTISTISTKKLIRSSSGVYLPETISTTTNNRITTTSLIRATTPNGKAVVFTGNPSSLLPPRSILVSTTPVITQAIIHKSNSKQFLQEIKPTIKDKSLDYQYRSS